MEPDFSQLLQGQSTAPQTQTLPSTTGTVTTPVAPTPTPEVQGPDFNALLNEDPFVKTVNQAADGSGLSTEPHPYVPDNKGGIFALGRLAVSGNQKTPAQGLNNSSPEQLRSLDANYVAPKLPTGPSGEPAVVLPPGSNVDASDRFNVSLTDNLDEKAKSLKNAYPFGDVQAVQYPDGSKALLIKVNPATNEYARVSPSFQEKVERFKDLSVSGTLGMFGLNPTGKVLSTSGDKNPEALSTAAANLLLDVFADNPVDTAIGLLSAVLIQPEMGILQTGGVGSAIGAATNTAKDIYNNTRGVSDKSATGIAADSTITGMFTGLFAAAGKVLGNLSTGLKDSFGEIPPAIRKIRQAAKELGLPDLMPQQASPSPFVRRLTAQSESIKSEIGAYREGQEETASNLISDLIPKAPGKVTGEPEGAYRQTFFMQLNDSLEKWKQNTLKMITDPKVSFEKAGTTMIDAINDVVEAQQNTVKALYAKAKAAGSPEYDITKVQDLAKNILTGKTQMGQPGSVPSSIINPTTNLPMGNIPVPAKPVRVSDTTDLLPIIDDIIKLDPSVKNANGVSTPTDALEELRRRLWEYTLPDPTTGLRRAGAREATQLRVALDDAMENPIAGANVRPLWRDAAKAQKDVYDVLEVARIRQMLKAENGDLVTTPESMARTLLGTTGRNAENISRIFATIPKDKREIVQQAVVSEMLRNPGTILENLEKYKASPGTYSQLFNPADVPKLEAIGTKFKQLQTSGIPDIIQQHQNHAFQTVAALINNNPTITQTMLEEFTKQPGSLLHQDLRAGIIDYIFQNAKEAVPEGANQFIKIDASTLIKLMDNLGENGKLMLRFLTKDDLKTIGTVADYLNLIQSRQTDMGAVLHGGAAVQAATKLKLDAVHAFTSAKLVGWAVTNGFMQKLLMGPPVATASEPTVFLSRVGAVLGSMLNEGRKRAFQKDTDLGPTNTKQFADGGLVQVADMGSNTTSESMLQKKLDDFFRKTVKKIGPDAAVGSKDYVDIKPIQYPVGKADGGFVDDNSAPAEDDIQTVPELQSGLEKYTALKNYLAARKQGIQADIANNGEGLREKMVNGMGVGSVKMIRGVPGGMPDFANEALFSKLSGKEQTEQALRNSRMAKEFGASVEGGGVDQELGTLLRYGEDILPKPFGKLDKKGNDNRELRRESDRYDKAVAAQNVGRRPPEPVEDPVVENPIPYNSVPFTKLTETPTGAANIPDPEFLDKWRTSLRDAWDRGNSVPFNNAVDIVYLEMSGNTNTLTRTRGSLERWKKVQNAGELYDNLKQYVSSAYQLPLLKKPSHSEIHNERD